MQLGKRAPRITRESVLALIAPRNETPRKPAAPSETWLDRALARTRGKPRKSGENAAPPITSTLKRETASALRRRWPFVSSVTCTAS